MSETYGHTPIRKMFDQADVYGIGHDPEAAARPRVVLGLIGAGGVAQSKYLPALQRLRTLWEPVEVAAVADPLAEQGRKVAALYGCRWYPDHEQMLARERLDGVLVLSPDHLHARHAAAALESGRHVLAEKPITRSLVDAQRICRLAEERSLTLMAVANKRCSPPYRRARRLIDQGPVQHPALFSGKFNLGYPYVQLLEQGTVHLLDLARYLMGDVAAVHAVGVNRYGRNQLGYPFDNLAATLRFRSGAVGSLTTSSTALSLKPWERVEVYGDGAWLVVEDQYTLTLFAGEEAGAQSWSPVIPNTLLFDEEFGGYMGLVANFAQAIRGAEQPLVTGWDGYAALELVVACHLSLARAEPVWLPLDPAAADAEYQAWLQGE